MKIWWPRIVTVVSVTWVKKMSKLHIKASLIIQVYKNEKRQRFGVFWVDYIAGK